MGRGRRVLGSLLLDMFADAAQEVYTRWKEGRGRARRDSDPYRILGVEPGDSPELVTAVFRAKAKLLHPDKKTGDAEKFKRLHAAYEAVKAQAERSRR